MTTIEKNEIALIPPVTALELFQGGQVRTILDKIKDEVLSIVTDPTTEKGRKEIASLAHKVARTKVALDEMGKSLTDEQRRFIDSINAERRLIVTELDELKETVRRPLTEFENREKERVTRHEARIAEIRGMGENLPSESSNLLEIGTRLKEMPLDGFEEFEGAARLEKDSALLKVNEAYCSAVARDKAEAERIERERIEREEREARIAAEAAEKARIAAEEDARRKAEAEAARVAEEARRAEEAREAERRAEAERLAAIEREKVEAEDRHRREIAETEARVKREAEEAERDRLAKEAAEKAKAEKVAANRKHRDRVMKEAAAALVDETGLGVMDANAVVSAIVNGKIPNVSVNF